MAVSTEAARSVAERFAPPLDGVVRDRIRMALNGHILVTVLLDEEDQPLGEAWVEVKGLSAGTRKGAPLAEAIETDLNEFLERDLGPEGLRRSVVVVATSDEPALVRVQAALTATAVAEYFRDQGRDVLLLMDSVTRFAMAQREIGLAANEPPATRGYPPSVFALLPKLVERAGRAERGSITAFYSVLVEGDDTNEPVSDCVRGLLDGHTILSRRIAARGHYPAIDVMESISRVMPSIVPAEHRDAALKLKEWLAAYRDHEDLISIGAYRSGANPAVDTAIALRDECNRFLQQRVDERATVESARTELLKLVTKGLALKKPVAAVAAAAPSPVRTGKS